MSLSLTYNAKRPLLLQSFTLDIVTNFLHPLYLNSVLDFQLIFSHWDFRYTMWLFIYSFCARKLQEFYGNNCSSQLSQANNNNLVFNRSDFNKFLANIVIPRKALSSSSTRNILNVYSNLLKKAIRMTLLLRLSFKTIVFIFLQRKFLQ